MREFNIGVPNIVLEQSKREHPGKRTLEVVRVPVQMEGNPLFFSVTLGSITEASVDAILCPSNPWFGLAAGAVENVILKEAGQEPFDAADAFMKQKEIDIPGFTRMDGVPYGAAKAFPSGRLVERGIQHVIFSNVLPNHERLTGEMVARCVGYAMLEADRVQAKTLAVPAIGTGFIGAIQGFSFEESVVGTIKGLERYHAFRQDTGRERFTNTLSLVIYAQANEGNAKQMKEMVGDIANKINPR